MKPAPAQDLANALTTTFAELVAIEGHGHRVRLLGGELVDARRAVGCLAEPAVGDRVLVAGDATRGEWYVLSVLDREPTAPVELSAEHDLTILSRNGAVRLLAAGELSCAAGRAFRVVSPEVHMDASEGHVSIGALEYVGDSLRAQIERVRTVARFFDTQAERWVQRVDRCIRFVQEIDLLRAKQVDHTAEETLHLRAKHALLTANQVVKIDGDQIQLG